MKRDYGVENSGIGNGYKQVLYYSGSPHDAVSICLVINGEVNESIIGKQMSGQFSILIINNECFSLC